MMGEMQLPFKFPTNFYVATSTSTSGQYDLCDSHLLLPTTTPTFKPKFKFLGLPSFSKKSSDPKTNADGSSTPKTRRSISDGPDSLHSTSSRVPSIGSPPSSTFSIKLDSEGSDDEIEKIAGVQDALLKCDDDDEDPPEGPMEVAPQVDYFMEGTEGNGEELNGKAIEMNKKKESLAFKLPVRLPTSYWERKLRTCIARMRSKAEEMNMKRRTTVIDWNGGEVRVLKGEELWYMKELKGMRCRPLESEALYNDRKSKPVPLLDCRDVYGTKDGDEERPSCCARREGDGRNAGFF